VREPEVGALLFWGYGFELERLRAQLRIALPQAPACSSWGLLSALAKAFLANEDDILKAPMHDDVYALLEECHAAYKSSNSAKGLIRNSLPIYVAEPVIAAICVARRMALPPLPAILEKEFKREPTKRIQFMTIRGTSGGIFFMRPDHDGGEAQ
jgi:hypothetical protein